MSNPSAPPPYEDRNPLYPGSPPQGGYGQPSVLPGGYPAYPAYPQPGYGHPAGYPQPMPPIHPMPMHYGPGQGYDGEERAVSESFGPGEWDDRKVRHTFIRKVRHGLGGHCPWAPWAGGMGCRWPGTVNPGHSFQWRYAAAFQCLSSFALPWRGVGGCGGHLL
uniref:TMBIM1 n=1 Tax=Neovison vison TaxID=452646 RepID=A0A8C7EWJ9_NEOVI